MNKERALYLIQQYRDHSITESELAELDKWLQEHGGSELISDAIETDMLETAGAAPIDADLAEKMFRRVMAADGQMTPPPVRSISLRWVAAASIILALGVGGWWWTRETTGVRPESSTVARANDVPAPKETRAVIVLADGTRVYLDSAGSGTLATEANINLIKTADGRIIYRPTSTSLHPDSGTKPQSDIVYNTLSNPRGSQVIDVQLSDGSHVWLNAGSSLKYPVAFVGKERSVEITGEAYFEVAHITSSTLKGNPLHQEGRGSALPFIVKSGNMTVEVLGTHFNVNAYEDEEMLRVTLLEGSVAVRRETSNVRLVPGQQAIAGNDPSTPLRVAKDVDVDEVMAWKNGRFLFDKTDVQATMRQIARWYDVDIQYRGQVKGFFSGGISRLENASEVLKMLEMTGEVKFKIEGRKVIVMP